jgi:glycerol-3-phosphate acyltransferase PlsY
MKILYALLTYLLGSLPTGYILFLITEKKDIRNFGSHSTGATNVLRVKGWKLAIPVLAIDLLKGAIPVFIALRLFEDQGFSVICAFLAVVGHCFPVYLKFKGGKGVATTVGVYSVLAFKPFLLSLAVFFFVVLITRYVSLASLLSIILFPLFVFLVQGNIQIIGLGIAVFALVAIRHRENIGRLARGTERKIGESVR